MLASRYHITTSRRTKDEKDGLRSTADLSSNRSPHNLKRVIHIVNTRICCLVLAELVASVCGQQAHGNNKHNPRHEPDGCKYRRQRENTKGNGLRNHDQTSLPVRGSALIQHY